MRDKAVEVKKTRKEKGQSLVEFALVIPLLLLMVGIFEFGYFFITTMRPGRSPAWKVGETMKNRRFLKSEKAQSMVELAYTLPIIILILLGMIEIVFFARAYLILLDTTVVGARLGSQGEAYYNDDELLTMTYQSLAAEGYDSSDVIDVIITRAELVNGTDVQNYRVVNMLSSGQSSHITAEKLQSRLESGDPSIDIIVVEILFHHRLLFNLENILPDPPVIRAFTINALPG